MIDRVDLAEHRHADGNPGGLPDHDVDELPKLSIGQVDALTDLPADHLDSPAVHDPATRS